MKLEDIRSCTEILLIKKNVQAIFVAVFFSTGLSLDIFITFFWGVWSGLKKLWANYFTPQNSILKGVEWSEVEPRLYKWIVINLHSNFTIVIKKPFHYFCSSGLFLNFFMWPCSDCTSYSIIICWYFHPGMHYTIYWPRLRSLI